MPEEENVFGTECTYKMSEYREDEGSASLLVDASEANTTADQVHQGRHLLRAYL